MDDMICFDVYALQQAFTEHYRPLLAPLGLTYPQYLVMVALWREDGAPLGAIGRELGLQSNTLTPIVKRLEQAGLLTRRRDAGDERRVLVSLTERGRKLSSKAADIPSCVVRATGLDRGALSGIQDDLRALRRALRDR